MESIRCEQNTSVYEEIITSVIDRMTEDIDLKNIQPLFYKDPLSK